MAEWRHGGLVVYRGQDDYGPIEVVDDGAGERSLHFGSAPRQSTLLLNEPSRLALSYTRAMLTPLLLGRLNPRRVLLVGLGGGSLVRWLRRHYPDCHVDAVELRDQVVEVAKSWFGLDGEDPHLQLHVAEAGRFLRTAPPKFGHYDLILVDAFTARGMAHEVEQTPFFQACRSRLADNGWLAVNFWSGDYTAVFELVDLLRDAFDGFAMQLPITGKENVVAFSTNRPVPFRELRRLTPDAERLEQLHAIEYPRFLKQLRRANNGWFF